MRSGFAIFVGIFGVMALSNAIVPILSTLAEGSTFQGVIFSAYFFGAFLLTLPTGILSDRYGPVPFIQAGLILTTASGILFLVLHGYPAGLMAARLIEGCGAGLFVASSLSILNSHPDHDKMSGYFMALLNAGLIAGLIVTGITALSWSWHLAGVAIFTAMTVLPLIASFWLNNRHIERNHDCERTDIAEMGTSLVRVIREYFWLWFSAVVLVGATGVVTSLYPEFTDQDPVTLGIWIAMMNASTIVAVLLASHAHLAPVTAIRTAAALSAAAVIASYLTPWAFLLLGAAAGVVMIAQLSFLAMAEPRQGMVMGLFNSASYAGMAILPAFAGLFAEITTFFIAFLMTVLLIIIVVLTIGRCSRCTINRAPV